MTVAAASTLPKGPGRWLQAEVMLTAQIQEGLPKAGRPTRRLQPINAVLTMLSASNWQGEMRIADEIELEMSLRPLELVTKAVVMLLGCSNMTLKSSCFRFICEQSVNLLKTGVFNNPVVPWGVLQ